MALQTHRASCGRGVASDDGRRAFVSHAVGARVSVVDIMNEKSAPRVVKLGVIGPAKPKDEAAREGSQGFALAKAKTEIEKLGLKPVVRWVSLAETATYVVLNQKPVANEKVKPGAEVEVVVNR